MSRRLEHMLNIGPHTAQLLRTIGIPDAEALARIGAVEAWRRLRAAFPHRVTRNALYAIEGALIDARWNALPPSRRADIEAAAARIEKEDP
ncbi:MAG: TfoX/Sxy family DNA transformation protein [bacterium]|nr:TfoX/Sxy family DNA transformation protein [Myxococcales bacterium]